jgi:hypothetical protein
VHQNKVQFCAKGVTGMIAAFSAGCALSEEVTFDMRAMWRGWRPLASTLPHFGKATNGQIAGLAKRLGQGSLSTLAPTENAAVHSKAANTKLRIEPLLFTVIALSQWKKRQGPSKIGWVKLTREEEWMSLWSESHAAFAVINIAQHSIAAHAMLSLNPDASPK